MQFNDLGAILIDGNTVTERFQLAGWGVRCNSSAGTNDAVAIDYIAIPAYTDLSAINLTPITSVTYLLRLIFKVYAPQCGRIPSCYLTPLTLIIYVNCY